MGVKIHPGSLTIKLATDGGEDMLVGSLELNRWSGVMRFALTEKKIRQYVLKQERIEREGLVLSDIMHLEDGEDDENEISLSRGKEVASTGDDDDDDDEAALTHKRKASSVDAASKHRKVSSQSSFSAEVRTLYLACRIKNIFSNVVEHKAQVGAVQFLYDEGWGDGV